MNAENINLKTGCVACTYADAFGRSCQYGSLFPLLVWMTDTLVDVEEVNKLRDEWLSKMFGLGMPVEIIHRDVPKSTNNVPEYAEIVPEEADFVQNTEETAQEEPQYDHLTATPKAVQLELELF